MNFLGNVEQDRLKGIQQALSDIVAGHEPITLSFRGIGCFPSIKRAHVIWAGIEDNPQLERLYTQVDTAIGVCEGRAPL